tara:strand:+ start:279 stop:410 length:132 start_codon:yes stop_codon:yes gene_type:complete
MGDQLLAIMKIENGSSIKKCLIVEIHGRALTNYSEMVYGQTAA